MTGSEQRFYIKFYGFFGMSERYMSWLSGITAGRNIWKQNKRCAYTVAAKCSPGTLVSGDTRFVRLFAGVSWREGVKQEMGYFILSN